MKTIACGGFNTGRLYGREGQRIYWFQFDDGSIWFIDKDRMIDGHIDGYIGIENMPRWIMTRYDSGQYDQMIEGFPYWTLNAPENYNYGPMLRI